ncbi:MAG TPA: PepSY-like domain-containing protein [Parafilimonas sp.]|nr:PepSY-like domain-containing protein [Parafilimonas sp.]
MKRIFFLLVFFSAFTLTNAQIRKIPAEVTDAFAQRYPHATKVEWKDKLQYFEASFELNGSEISADFSSKGEWQGSERDMNFDDLPTEVKDGFAKSKYSDWDKKSVSEIQELGKPLQYKINVGKSDVQKKNLFFDANGKLLKDNITL